MRLLHGDDQFWHDLKAMKEKREEVVRQEEERIAQSLRKYPWLKDIQAQDVREAIERHAWINDMLEDKAMGLHNLHTLCVKSCCICDGRRLDNADREFETMRGQYSSRWICYVHAEKLRRSLDEDGIDLYEIGARPLKRETIHCPTCGHAMVEDQTPGRVVELLHHEMDFIKGSGGPAIKGLYICGVCSMPGTCARQIESRWIVFEDGRMRPI